MRKAQLSSPTSAPPARTQRGQSGSNLKLEQLSKRFEAFRNSNPPTAQIPVALRKAVLAVLQSGATKSAVQRICGVSWTQMDQWQKLYKTVSRPRRARPPEPARVLPVVDADRSPVEGLASSTQPLELRLGGWVINVRPIDDSQEVV